MEKPISFPQRKSPRLSNYDYSQCSYYFITVCTHRKKCIFGTAADLNWRGKLVQQEILQVESHFHHVKVENYIVMPNHIHAILVLEKENTHSLSEIVGLLKSGVSRKIHEIQPELEIWQRSFHDHVIRSQSAYEKIWNYVEYNPQKWEEDCFYPKE